MEQQNNAKNYSANPEQLERNEIREGEEVERFVVSYKPVEERNYVRLTFAWEIDSPDVMNCSRQYNPEGGLLTKKRNHFLGSGTYSLSFPDGKVTEWRMVMDPNYREDGKRYVSLMAYMTKLDPSLEYVDTIYELQLLTGSGKIITRKVSSLRRFTHRENCHGWLKFLKYGYLEAHDPHKMDFKAILKVCPGPARSQCEQVHTVMDPVQDEMPALSLSQECVGNEPSTVPTKTVEEQVNLEGLGYAVPDDTAEENMDDNLTVTDLVQEVMQEQEYQGAEIFGTTDTVKQVEKESTGLSSYTVEEVDDGYDDTEESHYDEPATSTVIDYAMEAQVDDGSTFVEDSMDYEVYNGSSSLTTFAVKQQVDIAEFFAEDTVSESSSWEDNGMEIDHETIAQGIRDIVADLWKTKANANSEIFCDSGRLKVHSYVLKARSPVFRAHFEAQGDGKTFDASSALKLSSVIFASPENESQTDNLVAKNSELERLEGLIEYCYTGQTELFSDFDKTSELLLLAQHLQVHSLTKRCVEELMKKATFPNITKTYELVRLIRNADGDTEADGEYTKKNFIRELLKLHKMNPDMLPDLKECASDYSSFFCQE